MARPDLSWPVRAAASAVFAYEAAALAESVAADTAGRRPRFLTISAFVWRHPVLIPVACAALAVHLTCEPDPKEYPCLL